MRLAFVGDISLNGKYCDPKNFSNIFRFFSEVRNFLDERKISLLIGNLESPLRGGSRENILKEPRIHTDIKVMESIKLLAPAIFTVANNHIYDCLEEGFIKTKNWLLSNGFGCVGAGIDIEEARRPFRLSKNGNKISIFSYVVEDTHPSLPENCGVYLNFLERERALYEIRKEAPSAFVIVTLHWGVEFSHYPSPWQRETARSFIEAGAKLIIGHHPHIIQGFEIWGGGYIFYSLGNFAFADILDTSHPVLWTSEQLHGGIALICIENGEIKNFELIPTYIDNLIVKIESSRIWYNKIRRRCQPLMFPILHYDRFWKKYYFLEFIIKPPFRYFFGERKNFFRQLSKLILKDFFKALLYFKKFLLYLIPRF